MTTKITEIDQKIEYCPCKIGCNLCSGAGFFDSRTTITIKEFYGYYRKSADYKGKSFTEFMFADKEDPYYTFDEKLEKQLEYWYLEQKINTFKEAIEYVSMALPFWDRPKLDELLKKL